MLESLSCDGGLKIRSPMSGDFQKHHPAASAVSRHAAESFRGASGDSSNVRRGQRPCNVFHLPISTQICRPLFTANGALGGHPAAIPTQPNKRRSASSPFLQGETFAIFGCVSPIRWEQHFPAKRCPNRRRGCGRRFLFKTTASQGEASASCSLSEARSMLHRLRGGFSRTCWMIGRDG